MNARHQSTPLHPQPEVHEAAMRLLAAETMTELQDAYTDLCTGECTHLALVQETAERITFTALPVEVVFLARMLLLEAEQAELALLLALDGTMA